MEATMRAVPHHVMDMMDGIDKITADKIEILRFLHLGPRDITLSHIYQHASPKEVERNVCICLLD
jgi:hypothetical protein